MEEAEKISRLQSMFENAKALSHTGDPILDEQAPLLTGLLFDILRLKDPTNVFGHILEYE